jgi:hypothetical protein
MLQIECFDIAMCVGSPFDCGHPETVDVACNMRRCDVVVEIFNCWHPETADVACNMGRCCGGIWQFDLAVSDGAQVSGASA